MITASTQLPRYVRDVLAAVPARGGGLNHWLYKAARVLHPFRLNRIRFVRIRKPGNILGRVLVDCSSVRQFLASSEDAR